MAAEGKNADIAQLAAGAVFHGVYEVIRCIKAGGMGAVYEVLQRNTERKRALKVMLPSLVTDPEMRARFELEAKIAAGIESEHIVETLDAGVDEATGMPFIVMELLKGEELGRMLKERRRLPPDEVVTLLHQAALALDKTHAAGIIHRDLKPENLFITRRDDGTPRLKILDFGVAKIVHDGTVNASSTKSVGSPLYMAPEQISGDQKIGPAVDRYALAHIAFTLLVGKPYWHRERKASEGLYSYLMQVMRGAQVPASERAADLGVSLPPAFDAWFAKATTITWAERFDSAVEQITALAEAFDVVSPVTVAPKPTRTPLPSIVAGAELPLSIPPPSSAAETVPAPTATTSDPPPSVQEPSSAALTRSSVLPEVRPDEPHERRRKSVAPLLAFLLLLLGVGAVGGAFFLWPKRMQSMLAPSSAPPEPTTKAPAAVATPADVVPAVLPSPSAEAAAPASSVAPLSSAAAPASSASAVASAVPLGSAAPLPSGSAPSYGTNPFGKKPPIRRKGGTNPLDEY